MSDISQNLDTNIVCFTDDTRLFKSISDHSDSSILQSDPSKVYIWALVNNMLFNDSKFTHISFSESKHQPNISYKNLSNEHKLNSDSTKYLGIIVSEDLQFNKYIKDLTRRCRQFYGWILRTFSSRDHFSMLTIFRSMVSCRLDCGCQLWSPSKLSNIKELKSVHYTYRRNG